MSTRTGPPADPAADVIERWHAGDRFGVLCTGDSVFAETVFRSLAPTAERSFGHAESVGPEDLAGFDGERVVALAWDLADVHPALLRRCTAVLGTTVSNKTVPDETVPGRAVARRTADRSSEDVAAATVYLLDSVGVRDHAVEIAAVRLAAGLSRGGCSDPLRVVRAVVAEPRRTTGAPGDPHRDPRDDPAASEDDAPTAADTAADPADEVGDDESGDSAAGPAPPEGYDAEPETESPPANPAGVPEEAVDDVPPGSADRDVVVLAGEPGDTLDEHADSPADADGQSHEIPGGTEERSHSGSARRGRSGGDGDGEPATVAPHVDRQESSAAIEVREVDVQNALRTTASHGLRNAKTHLRGGRGARARSPEHGPIARSVPPERVGGRVAAVPTLQRAARRRASSPGAGAESAVVLREDLRGAVRRRRGGHHTVVVVDGSSSLGSAGLLGQGSAADQMVRAIAARRGVTSVVVASGQRAVVVVERSTSLERTRNALLTAATGGGTPLAHALHLALELLGGDERARRRVLLLTDGQPTVGLCGRHLPERAAVAELAYVLSETTRLVPDVTLLPVGGATSRDRAPFVAAGVRVCG